MKTLWIAVPATLALVAGRPAHASAELAKGKNCLACHGVATKMVGPSFKDIAVKYANDAGAPARLEQKIRKGSTGVWGAMPMPANPQVSEAEAKALTQWILKQK